MIGIKWTKKDDVVILRYSRWNLLKWNEEHGIIKHIKKRRKANAKNFCVGFGGCVKYKSSYI